MQEGLSSLMQMAKTTAVLQELAEARLPFISILTDPTMGGVSASFAFVGDIVHRRAGRADRLRRARGDRADGREKLPVGFQRAEFLLEKGALDMIVDRRCCATSCRRCSAMLQHRPARAEARLRLAATARDSRHHTAASPLADWLALPRDAASEVDRNGTRAVATSPSRPHPPVRCQRSPAPMARARSARISTRFCARRLPRRLYTSPHLLRYNERADRRREADASLPPPLPRSIGPATALR
jgi:hypothetical protein